MDFPSDLKQIVIEQLTQLSIPFDPSAAVEDLLLLITNHELKNIWPEKRDVHTSSEFDEALKNLDAQMQAAAVAIQQKFKDGQDVSGHLSRGSDSSRANEIDQLRADWGIYHFHISNHKTDSSDAFFARTGPVMFVLVTATDVYFIDIYPHGGWTRQRLLEIVEHKWPHLLDSSRLKGVTELPFTPTDEDVKKLRRASINPVLKVGDSFLASPGGGLASDGTPIANVMRTDKTLRLVRNLQQFAAQNAASWKATISKDASIPESELDFELVGLLPSGFGIREKKTQKMVYQSPE